MALLVVQQVGAFSLGPYPGLLGNIQLGTDPFLLLVNNIIVNVPINMRIPDHRVIRFALEVLPR